MIGPVVYLSSMLPHSSVSVVAGFCLSRLKAIQLPGDWTQVHKVDLLPTYTNALCNWGRGDDLLELITEWLKKGTNDFKRTLANIKNVSQNNSNVI